jgi:hypothetical protein
MTLAPSPGLWLPGLRLPPWWNVRRRPAWRAPLAHLMASVKRKCCCGGSPCSSCTGSTSATMTATFASVALATACTDTSAGAAHSSEQITIGALNGSWTLPQATASSYLLSTGATITISNPACAWIYIGTDISLSRWGNSACSGSPFQTSDAFYILLQKSLTTTWGIQAQINFSIGDTVDLFFAGTSQFTDCTTAISGIANLRTNFSSNIAGKNGTAAWTP